jgi:mannose/fructose/N-acetylgalactosamine-specific phosphotransferase system component IIB
VKSYVKKQLGDQLTDAIDIALVRVDNRLVHGQILEAWVPYIKAQCIIVVSDNVASDFFCETVIRMAVPSEIEVIISPVEEFAKHYTYTHDGGKKTIVLFSSIADVSKAYKLGFHFDKLNIGNIYNEEYKICCAPSVFLCDKEIQEILELLEKDGVAIEIKRVPRERAVNVHDIIKKYCAEKP